MEDVIGGRGGFGGFGGGDGGGVIMGLVLGSLFNRRGFGGDEGGGCNSHPDISNIMQTLGSIQASVPLSEAQVQLALAGNQAAITQLVSSVGNQLQNGQTALLLQTANQTAQLQQAICDVDTNVDRTATATQAAIHADGEATRALITSQAFAELNQKLTVAQLEGQELRGERNRDRDRQEIQIQMIQNQNQQQQQQQAVQFRLNELATLFGQVARATQGNVIVGSTGTVANNTANPTNVAV